MHKCTYMAFPGPTYTMLITFDPFLPLWNVVPPTTKPKCTYFMCRKEVENQGLHGTLLPVPQVSRATAGLPGQAEPGRRAGLLQSMPGLETGLGIWPHSGQGFARRKSFCPLQYPVCLLVKQEKRKWIPAIKSHKNMTYY